MIPGAAPASPVLTSAMPPTPSTALTVAAVGALALAASLVWAAIRGPSLSPADADPVPTAHSRADVLDTDDARWLLGDDVVGAGRWGVAARATPMAPRIE